MSFGWEKLRLELIGAALATLLLLGGAAPAQEHPPRRPTPGFGGGELGRQWRDWISRPNTYERSHGSVLSAFSSVVSPVKPSTARIYLDSRPVAMGTIADSNGHILTKASEVLDRDGAARGRLACELASGKRVDAAVVGYETRYDLAMLKVEATGLAPAPWNESGAPAVGSLLATVGMIDQPVAIGVASASPREIETARGVLGIEIQPASIGPRVGRVLPKSAAERAKLQPGDVVLRVNEKNVRTPTELSAAIAGYQPGEVVRLHVMRDDKSVEVSATLDRYFPDEHAERREFQESLGSSLSERREGFPTALQHDTVLRPEHCGSPLVDLNGKVVGINIARAGRTASYAIPTVAILRLLPDLTSGKLAPKPPISQLISTQSPSASTAP